MRPYSKGLFKYDKIKNILGIKQFIHEFDHQLHGGDRLHDKIVEVNGRVCSSIRKHGNFTFYSIVRDNHMVQVMSNKKDINDQVRFGDIINVVGIPGKSKKKELSIIPSEINILAPCLVDLPFGQGNTGSFSEKMTNKDLRFKNRHVDLLINREQSYKIFKTRAKIINHLRETLNSLNFLEVETPIISKGIEAGGAKANPFVTEISAKKLKAHLRIAPELYLKTLIVGGFDNVYEIGKVFRNEGLSPVHNPEFTMLEFYKSYSNYLELMEFTEELIRNLCNLSNFKISSEPFKIIDTIPELEKQLKYKFKDLTFQTNTELINQLNEHNIEYNKHDDIESLLDTLISHVIEDNVLTNEPTFIINHPIKISPLAKAHDAKPNIAERFELYINKYEICNAYTELNDPIIQKERFKSQHENLSEYEINYCKALEAGLPPCAGFGLGIDRLTMILTNQKSIKEVIFFPL